MRPGFQEDTTGYHLAAECNVHGNTRRQDVAPALLERTKDLASARCAYGIASQDCLFKGAEIPKTVA